MTNHTSHDQSLRSRTVLITRPATQQQGLQRLIEGAGGVAVGLPVIEIQALPVSELQAAKSAIENLDHYNVVIFISSNAAHFGAEIINDFWPQFPVGVDVIAIGDTTARAVTSLLDCSVISPAQGSDSEALLQLPELQHVNEKKIAIIRGVGGRELLAQELTDRGAAVQYIEVYKRNFVNYSEQELNSAMIDSGCTAITVHSGESLKQLLALSGHNIAATTGLPLVVPSPRIAEQAREAGFSEVEIAQGASDSAMFTALQKLTKNADN